MAIYYPPTGFFFSVTMVGAGSRPPSVDGSFQEVSGIQADVEVDTVVEGGENRFSYRLPRGIKYSNLVMKRGVVTSGSALVDWITTTLSDGFAKPIVPRDVMVSLLNPQATPLVSWTFVSAYPVGWQLASLNSMQSSSVLVETLELAYSYFNRVAGSG